MTSRSSFLPRLSLGGKGSPILPTHHQRTRSDDHDYDYDLSELSPRPSSPLLSPDHVRDFGFHDSAAYHDNSKDKGNGKGKAKAAAYAEPGEQFPPISVVDRMRTHRQDQAASRERERRVREDERERNGPRWIPPASTDYRDHDARTQGYPANTRSTQNQGRNLGTSFMGFLSSAPSSTEQGPTNEVDNTFRTIQRRERQIQKELQKLLDAQARALDQGAASDGTSQAGSDTPRHTSRASSSPYRSRSVSSHGDPVAPAVVPVRQPKPRPLTIRQVRTSIARSMAMLSDLKEEEDACIVSAISARTTALAKANKLSRQHKAIAADLRTLEMDDPLRKELEGMNGEYGKVCADIDEFEGKLRQMKHRKRVLEARMEEVKSERESGLSGYKGALRETERDIGEMMRIPGVKVLSIEDTAKGPQPEVQEDNADDKVIDRALSGHEFMRMRPERRTLAMAKEWWEGEMALLSRRKDDVDKERDALSEGSEVWAQTVQLINDYERRLGAALSNSMQAPPKERQKSEADLFQAQYRDLQQTIKEIEKNLHHVEEKGWNLLVAAIGAELEGFMEGENILADLMRSKGYEVLADSGLLGLDDEQSVNNRDEIDTKNDAIVVRRWGGHSELRTPPVSQEEHREEADTSRINEPPSDLLQNHGDHRDESDNEVPADLLVSQVHREESEDEHANEVPAEFLSTHDGLPEVKAKQHGIEEEEEDNEIPRDLLGRVEVGTRDDGVE
ncbi:hypothetical protein BKA67DRAFT_108669 [Truncatella angustata]|uniref:Autophagy-related protein 28 n=1 Tax=Truncatella angustata TaxID=152316 RepID=A0A9P8UBR6_9PEZI|nr:uncharacterized protein BKA67DRAFT_108669 [Truncatella angustata]KAH6645260.1 hypothetical protein BKA67DRAFT_108669 [Truncatella angustata]